MRGHGIHSFLERGKHRGFRFHRRGLASAPQERSSATEPSCVRPERRAQAGVEGPPSLVAPLSGRRFDFARFAGCAQRERNLAMCRGDDRCLQRARLPRCLLAIARYFFFASSGNFAAS